jgi:hypothetical protein
MAVVPAEGYPTESKEFDQTYTQLLNVLQDALANGAQGKLGAAIGVMHSLTDLAVPLMQKPIPAGTGNYGPDFRRVS